MSFISGVKGALFTKIKKTMTKRMYDFYFNENKEAAQTKEDTCS